MKNTTIEQTLLESAWLAVVQLTAEHERDGLDAQRLRSLAAELADAINVDGGRVTA